MGSRTTDIRTMWMIRSIKHSLRLFVLLLVVHFFMQFSQINEIFSTNELSSKRAIRATTASSSEAAALPVQGQNNKNKDYRVDWISPNDLTDGDYYSGAWFMSQKSFLKCRVNDIKNLEGASFVMINDFFPRLRMSLDWLDWSVEYMSKWWVIVGTPQLDSSSKVVNNVFKNYIQNTVARRQKQLSEERSSSSSKQISPLQPAIAVIAFARYREDKNPKNAMELTKTSLGATLASLVDVGFGRIVVVGYAPEDEMIVSQVFLNLVKASSSTSSQSQELRIFDSQLAYVQASDEHVVSSYMTPNIPRATLVGLKEGMVGNDTAWTRDWLGSGGVEEWKYVFFTEADVILQTRESSLTHLVKAMDQDLILMPHRLQPIPYEPDFTSEKENEAKEQETDIVQEQWLVPREFKKDTLRMLDETFDACCDEQNSTLKPGKPPFMEHCGGFWWTCGFNKGRDHSRLEPYDFIRLEKGTGVTTIAGTEHGRRCLPAKRGDCKLKPQQQASVE